MYDINLLNSITLTRTLHYRKDLDDVFRLAQATPALQAQLLEIKEAIHWFDEAFSNSLNRAEITGYWFDFVNMILQRYALLFPVEIAAADNLVNNFFRRFFNSPVVSHVRASYRDNVTPLVFLGRGGAKAYYTLPPTVLRPLAIIHMPRAALNNVWRWTVLAHETGHDVYSSVDDLARELDLVVASAVNDALRSDSFRFLPVNARILVNGRPMEVRLTPEQFVFNLWSNWAGEVFADLFALLMCGPAAVVTMQELLGFSQVGVWHGLRGPDPHPVPLLRNLKNIFALRRLGFVREAAALEERMWRFAPPVDDLIWVYNGAVEVARVRLDDAMCLAEVVTEAMLGAPLQCLNNHSLREIVDFNARDQATVTMLANYVAGGNISSSLAYEPRHVSAAAQIAFSHRPYLADTIQSSVVGLLARAAGLASH